MQIFKYDNVCEKIIMNKKVIIRADECKCECLTLTNSVSLSVVKHLFKTKL